MAEVTATARREAVVRRAARGGLLNLMGAGVSGAGGIAITWLAASGLGAHDAGQFFTATSAFLLAVSVARLGTPTGLVYWVALSKRNRPDAIPGLMRAALLPAGIASMCIATLLFVAAPWLADSHADSSHAYVEALRLLAVFLPCAVAVEALLAATRGLGRMRPSVAIDKVGRTGAQLAMLALVVVWLDGGVLPVTLAWTLPYLPAAVAATWSWHRSRPPLPPGSRRRTVEYRRFWTYTWPRALAGVIQLALQRLDIVLVAALLGFAEAAVYTVATRFITLGQMVSGAIGTAVQPRLATSMGTGDHETARVLYQATTCWIVLATWPLFLVAAVAAPFYLGFFGDEYVRADAIAAVWLLAAGMLLASASGVVDSVLAMAGRTGWQLYNVCAALVVNVVLDLWLIPRWGIVGAAVGWTAALAVNNLIPLSQLAYVFGLHPFGVPTLLAMGLAVVCFATVPVAGMSVGGAMVPTALAAACVVYAVSAWRFRKVLIRPAIT